MKATALDPDTLTPAARRILDAAAELFYARGITAVGVDAVASASGVTKRTLYDRFGSKDVLVATYLLERDRRWRRLLLGRLDEVAAPDERLLIPFHVLAEWNRGNPRGCAFINALAEIPDEAHPGFPVAAAEKQWLRELFTTLAGDAAIARPEEIGLQLMCLHEGALASSRVAGVGMVDAAAAAARTIVAAADRR
ncbi:MAG: TetR family transcriptional regulator [Microbacterium sp.]|uniref:TetR/AcrR family transcriptional regulator n=1 Tax=Microbacterium aquimaris TaxID=459816 RepID=UPI000C94D00B|nr:TetR family transcriptional regulator [Microbacterium aquimaris]MAP62472.1 TetR family transcriptional regulator [Microbacterium sp.]MDZ8276179.1 TetR family transcriptional regulator [Microbacterium aquimaris]